MDVHFRNLHNIDSPFYVGGSIIPHVLFIVFVFGPNLCSAILCVHSSFTIILLGKTLVTQHRVFVAHLGTSGSYSLSFCYVNVGCVTRSICTVCASDNISGIQHFSFTLIKEECDISYYYRRNVILNDLCLLLTVSWFGLRCVIVVLLTYFLKGILQNRCCSCLTNDLSSFS